MVKKEHDERNPTMNLKQTATYSAALLTLALLAGCGVDTMSAAATAAAIKKQELQQGQKTMEQSKEKIGKAMELEQQRANQGTDQ
jgi:hypothetical protein